MLIIRTTGMENKMARSVVPSMESLMRLGGVLHCQRCRHYPLPSPEIKERAILA
jgi:hypothetical protein